MKPFRIFIVEDDRIFAKLISHYLSSDSDYEVEIFTNGKDCLKNLYKNPSIISLDYNLPGMKGLEILKAVKKFNPELPVIIVSGQQDISTALELLKKGAYDYILKDENTKERLWKIILNIKENFLLKKKIDNLEKEIEKKYKYGNLIKGNSQEIKKVFSLIEKAIKTNITVSITGETGTGKDLVAKSIHYNSPQCKNPFVAVNVSAIPESLIESEFFGHEKGAFTGADQKRIGKFEEANNGTLFLDEIADMNLNMQAKLLRVLQEGEITRLGGNKLIKVNVRLIIATNKNLLQEVKNGNFRQDLYYRILGLPIHLPPLRARANDILLLSKHFIDLFSKENDLGKFSLSDEAKEKLKKYHYPGNVRELKAVIELASVMADDNIINSQDISFFSDDSIKDILNKECSLKEYEKIIIKHFLIKYDNKVRLVAKKLDIGKTTIYRLLKN